MLPWEFITAPRTLLRLPGQDRVGPKRMAIKRTAKRSLIAGSSSVHVTIPGNGQRGERVWAGWDSGWGGGLV